MNQQRRTLPAATCDSIPGIRAVGLVMRARRRWPRGRRRPVPEAIVKSRLLVRFLAVAAVAAGFSWEVPMPASSTALPCADRDIPHYTARRVARPPVIDGRLDEPAWQAAERSSRFVDLITGEPTLYDTRVAVLWDDDNLYVGFWVEEPNVAATLTRRDSPIYENNDVEVFIAGRDAYYEFEINALNTIYEAFFIWEEAYERGGFASVPEFARGNPLVRPFNGVGFRTHPRGPRLGSWAFDFPGLKTAVHVDGTLNQPGDKDRGWTVELAFPWSGMTWLARADGRSLPPREGDTWRIDFSRFNQYKAPPPSKDSGGWALSCHGIWDSHVPECFPYVHFSTAEVGAGDAPARPPR